MFFIYIDLSISTLVTNKKNLTFLIFNNKYNNNCIKTLFKIY